MERAAEFEATRRRDFERMLAWSFGVHVGVVALALFTPSCQQSSPPAVIAVELLASLPSAATRPALPQPAAPKPAEPKPVPIPEAQPEPPKPKPKPKEIVLPKEARQEPKPKPEPAAKPKPRREVVIDPKPKQEKSLEELLADMREEQGEVAPAPAPAPGPASTPVQAAVLTGPVPSAGSGTMSAEEADWRRRAKLHVQQAWKVPPGFRMETLETHVIVRLDAAGNVIGTPSIERRSGNPWYDEGVIRGIEKASPLPPPPEPGNWSFVFVPEDAY